MTDRELEGKIRTALDHAAPDDFEGVFSRCEPRKGAVIHMKKTTKRPWPGLIAACLALVLVGGFGGTQYHQAHAVASVVSLDVNPSIELTVNKNETVLSCTGLNAQAAEILADFAGGKDLEKVKIKVAVNAIVGSLLQHGYLEEISSAILISVEDRDQTRAQTLQQELTSTVDAALQQRSAQASVLSQTVTKDAALEQQAQANNISTGKAALIRRIIALNGVLSFDALSALSVEELKDLADIGAPAMPIGRDAALKAALTCAGLDAGGANAWEVDAELDERTPHYEVELISGSAKGEYLVDAFTGAVLSGPRDLLAPTPAPQPSAPVSSTGITSDKAFDLAAADFIARFPDLSGSNILDQTVKLDRDDGRAHYDVEFWIGGWEVDYEIDTDTGAVLEWDTDYEGPKPSTSPDPKPSASAASDIGRDAAKAAALKHAGLSESQVTRLQVERDMEHGRLEYEVDFKSGGMEYEYTIDGATGAVLEHERDRDD